MECTSMNNCKMTVLVVTYNSKLEKLILTLESILQQNFENFEIVIADDASKENYSKQLEKYFEYRQFVNYKLVVQEKNLGTVKNLICGLQWVNGKYVKCISAGDTLYDEYTLKKIYDFMEEEQSECCFGLMQGYRRGKKDVEKVSFPHPFDIEAYRKKKSKRIQRNLILYSDNVSGASLCYEKNFAVEYLNKISDCVIYEEDIFQVLSAVEDRSINFLDDYVVWYEYGEGISTGGQSKFQKALAKDTELFYEKLYKDYPQNRYIRKRYGLMRFYRIRNLYLRTVLRFFANPHLVCYLAGAFLQRVTKKHEKPNTKNGFLDREIYWKNIETITDFLKS